MSENLFKKIGQLNEAFKKQAWLTKPIYYLLDKMAPKETREDLDWNDEADLAILEQTPIRAKVLLYSIAVALAVLIIWAFFAKIDEVTRGEGRVIPSKQVQVIQSLDGGIVSEILVSEGQVVKVGTPLIRIDQTRAVSSLRENQTQYLALLAKKFRLKALANDAPFTPPDEVLKDAPQTYDQEYKLYTISKDELQSGINIARDQMDQRQKELVEVQYRKDVATKNLESASKELAANKPLLVSGAVSDIDILKLEREVTKAKGDVDQARAQISRIESSVAEARRKVTEVEQTFKSKVRTELNEVTARLNSITETSVGLTDKVKQATLTSPVNGKVSRLYTNTVGGVIQPGKEVLEIVPTDEALILETKIQIKDIAFIRLEQPAVVKLTAYDYSIYGALDGKVEGISANSVVDEKGNAYYVVRVRTLKSSLGKGLPIIPGMVAQVDVMTGKKTVLSYLLKPVLKAKSYAFSER
ncbi:HlyD family type I secretion periplasmic adaptor subunit [Methylotenera sp.]|uniref:HlyD family type I secretion periplasmic adaptor subunit n=1 Tax=Methylotenera sp. TaxID=2051956 RepID=UPI002488CA9C|nr:HlyD family type I secretion periplasmic adaptor subunit [Methylotenera sp.]MDI1298131.1 HlyD family type I secretion periplasmic adaptor subunit [Methylotenera sp.]